MKKKYYLCFIFLFALITNAQPCYREMQAGRNFTIALKADNTLWAVGANTYGQLGNGNTTSSINILQIGSDSDWAQIAVADYSVLAIKTNGTLWAWGRNESGQLGIGNIIDISVPTQVGTATNWQQVSIGRWNATGIKTDGTLWTWGRNQQGMLGDGTTTDQLSPVQIGTENNWSKVAMGYYHTLAIKTNGTLWNWGSNVFHQINGSLDEVISTPTQVGTETNWAEIAAGNAHNVAIKSDGTIWSWGYNELGYLGNGSYADNFVPTQIAISGSFQKIAVGLGHSIALKSDGSIWAWGLNTTGQIGNNTTNTIYPDLSVLSPIQVGTDTNWTKIAVGSHSTFASKDDSNWAWGINSQGMLGNGQTSGNTLIPSLVINCNTLSNDELITSTDYLTVYPNPANDFINLESNYTPIQKIEIYDTQGRLVLSQIVRETLLQYQLNISELYSGSYLLKATTNQGIESVKIIKR
jgi:alpha-tubulin suppressor-like RCC1 family protein